MSSQDLQEVGEVESPSGDAGSFLRWIVATAVIVVLAAGAFLLVRMLPPEDPSNEGSLNFPIRSKPQGPPGRIVLTEDTSYTFGVMPQKETGTHTWILKNAGEGDLELSQGPSTCSCTIANFSDKTKTFRLGPDKSTEITLSWETRDFDGKYGPKSATINILGDPDQSQVVFSVEGTVRPAVAVMPKERILSFGDVPSDQTASSRFAVASADQPDLKILNMTSTKPGLLTLTAKPLPDEDRTELGWTAMTGGYLIEVELQPSKDLGVFREEIVVATDHPRVSEIRLTASGKRSGPISVIPEAIHQSNLRPDSGGSVSVMLLVRDAPETKFEVLSKPDNLKVEVIPADLRTGSAVMVRQYRVTVTVPPGTPSGEIEGVITLKSDHPLAEQVVIPVDIAVLGGN